MAEISTLLRVDKEFDESLERLQEKLYEIIGIKVSKRKLSKLIVKHPELMDLIKSRRKTPKIVVKKSKNLFNIDEIPI